MIKNVTLPIVFPKTRQIPDLRVFTPEGPSKETLNYILAYSRALQVHRLISGLNFVSILN